MRTRGGGSEICLSRVYSTCSQPHLVVVVKTSDLTGNTLAAGNFHTRTRNRLHSLDVKLDVDSFKKQTPVSAVQLRSGQLRSSASFSFPPLHLESVVENSIGSSGGSGSSSPHILSPFAVWPPGTFIHLPTPRYNKIPLSMITGRCCSALRGSLRQGLGPLS